MRFIVSEHAQGTAEWLQDRAGKATGSKAAAITSFLKEGNESAARRDYRIELALERLTGQAAEQEFITKEMARGTEQEPYARMAFEDKTGLFVSESGFVYLPDIMAGCSVEKRRCAIYMVNQDFGTAERNKRNYSQTTAKNAARGQGSQACL